ncbi:MAG: hypothetical protein LUG95_09455 [Clostridiales bacterium]|nr:hypothetical protein [Clostridiales bacterium]
MKSKKVFLKIILISAISVIAIAVLAYFAYGSTLLNPSSEKSVINVLSSNKSNPIDILKIEKYKDYVAVLYTDPTDDKLHFAYFEKAHTIPTDI